MTLAPSNIRGVIGFLFILFLSSQSLGMAGDLDAAHQDPTLQRLLLANNQGLLSPSLIQTAFYHSSGITIADELSALIRDRSPELECRFPARYSYMASMGFIKGPLDISHCHTILAKLEDLFVDEVWLVVASPSVKTPMSYFGHVALVFRRDNDLYFSRAVSFLADSERHESEFSLMLRGAIGSIPGTYTVNSFHQLVNKYIEIDQRSMTAYRLILEPEEINLLAMHLLEVYGFEIDYNFFSNNCSTGIRSLLEVAAGQIGGAEIFGRFTSPNTLVSALQDAQRIDGALEFEPTQRTIYDEYWALPREVRRHIREMLKNDTAEQIQSRDTTAASSTLVWITQSIYRLQFKAHGKPPHDYAKVMATSVDWGPNPYRVTTQQNVPQRAISIGYDFGKSNNPVFSLSPGLYDREFPIQTGDVRQTFRYFTGDFRVLSGRLQLDELRVLDLEFLSQRNLIWKPRSWKFQIGARRSAASEPLAAFGSYRLGNSWGGPNDLISLMGGFYMLGGDFSPSLTGSYDRSWGSRSLSMSYSHYFSNSLDHRLSGLNLSVTQGLGANSAVIFSHDPAAETSLLSIRRDF